MNICISKYALGLVLVSKGLAADAVFSRDGNSVFIAASNEVERVNLKSPATDGASIVLPEGQVIHSLAAGADGEIFMLTEETVYAHDGKGTHVLCSVETVKNPNDLSVAPQKVANVADWLLVTGDEKDEPDLQKSRTFFVRKPGGKTPTSVFSRRIDQIGAGAFSADGRYLFVADDAIWDGKFVWPEGEDHSIMDAACIAPITYKDSSISNTGEYKLSESIAVAGHHVYAVLNGRHGEDLLVRLTIPAIHVTRHASPHFFPRKTSLLHSKTWFIQPA